MNDSKPKTITLRDLCEHTYYQAVRIWTYDDEIPFGFRKKIWEGEIEFMRKENPKINFEKSEIIYIFSSAEGAESMPWDNDSYLDVCCIIEWND